MSKDKEPKSSTELPAAAKILAKTLKGINDMLPNTPVDPNLPPEFREALILRQRFLHRPQQQSTPETDSKTDQEKDPTH